MINLPDGETHRVQLAFREDIAADTIVKMLNEIEPDEIFVSEYGITCLFSADNEILHYIDDRYGYAICMECDMDQKTESKSVWRLRDSETRILPVTRHGNSLTVNITQICNVLGISQGDNVRVTIETEEVIE